ATPSPDRVVSSVSTDTLPESPPKITASAAPVLPVPLIVTPSEATATLSSSPAGITASGVAVLPLPPIVVPLTATPTVASTTPRCDAIVPLPVSVSLCCTALIANGFTATPVPCSVTPSEFPAPVAPPTAASGLPAVPSPTIVTASVATGPLSGAPAG